MNLWSIIVSVYNNCVVISFQRRGKKLHLVSFQFICIALTNQLLVLYGKLPSLRVLPAEFQVQGGGGASGDPGAFHQVLRRWGPYDSRPAPPLPRGGSGRGSGGDWWTWPAKGGGGSFAKAASHYEICEA